MQTKKNITVADVKAAFQSVSEGKNPVNYLVKIGLLDSDFLKNVNLTIVQKKRVKVKPSKEFSSLVKVDTVQTFDFYVDLTRIWITELGWVRDSIVTVPDKYSALFESGKNERVTTKGLRSSIRHNFQTENGKTMVKPTKTKSRDSFISAEFVSASDDESDDE